MSTQTQQAIKSEMEKQKLQKKDKIILSKGKSTHVILKDKRYTRLYAKVQACQIGFSESDLDDIVNIVREDFPIKSTTIHEG